MPAALEWSRGRSAPLSVVDGVVRWRDGQQ